MGRIFRRHILAARIIKEIAIRPQLRQTGTRQFHSSFKHATSFSSESISVDDNLTRNIGIIAHIDAGKTTTTERMLYYSGHTRRIGDVDDGSTVTDFLPAERARGITIQSAAITFYWPPLHTDGPKQLSSSLLSEGRPRSHVSHRINLIDTPGHADFTFEVRRSLRVLDGAICVLDGVAGVEAQTEQVWNQAADWSIPRIVYINKLDRVGAAFGRTVKEIAIRLGGWPAVCQVPWFQGGRGDFCGIGDVVSLCGLRYEANSDGKAVKHVKLADLDEEEPSLARELRRARAALVELLSEHDDAMVEAFLEADEDHMSIPSSVIIESLRRCLLSNTCKIIPIFAGASFRNIGVQPLLDAVNNMLPSPSERPDAEVSLGEISGNLTKFLNGELMLEKSVAGSRGKIRSRNIATTTIKSLKGCALAFKVVNDPRKGVLVYIRVYSGSIDRNALLYNTSTRGSEKAMTLLRMYANESVPVQSIEAGQIGVIAGSKNIRTGDTLISCSTNKAVPPEPLDKLQLRPIYIPPPVFFASIEPNSLKDERDMHEKLSILLREDPSLHISQDEDTGQTLLSGMGELHLEIAGDRLVNDLRANASMGKIAIGYRETFLKPSAMVDKIFDASGRGDIKGKAGCSATVEPLGKESSEISDEVQYGALKFEQDGNVIIVNSPTLDEKGRPLHDDAAGLPNHLNLHDIQSAYLNGALAALARGPSYSFPVRNVCLTLTLDPAIHIFGNDTSYSALTAAARSSAIAAFRDAASSGGTALMEPVMNVDISIDDASLGSVVQDISSSRGGQILSLGDNEEAEAENEHTLPNSKSSRVEIDISKVYAPKDPFEFGDSANDLEHRVNKQRSIKARVPLKEMVGYLKHLRSMTGGRGTFTMSVDRFDRVTGQREKALINELRGGY